MIRIEPSMGDHVRDVIAAAMALAAEKEDEVQFDFNDVKDFIVTPTETQEEVHARWAKITGHVILSQEEERQQAKDNLQAMEDEEQRQVDLMEAEGIPDEKQLRAAKLPWPKTEEELLAEVRKLVDRPHTYGTCVYAMSIAAGAAFNYVSHKLGASGFQSSCADLDFVAKNRLMKHGFAIIDYGDLFYPQYWESDSAIKAPFYNQALAEAPQYFADEARERLANPEWPLHPRLRKHLEWIASKAPPQEKSDG